MIFAQNILEVLPKMESAYVEHKDFSDLFTRFAISFDFQSLDVFVWNSVEGLRRNTYFKENDYYGAYAFYPYRKRNGLFGEIHLVKPEIGAGYVAHEIQHFLFDWLLGQTMTDKTNERMATLAGNVTKEFWNEWHKVSK